MPKKIVNVRDQLRKERNKSEEFFARVYEARKAIQEEIDRLQAERQEKERLAKIAEKQEFQDELNRLAEEDEAAYDRKLEEFEQLQEEEQHELKGVVTDAVLTRQELLIERTESRLKNSIRCIFPISEQDEVLGISPFGDTGKKKKKDKEDGKSPKSKKKKKKKDKSPKSKK